MVRRGSWVRFPPPARRETAGQEGVLVSATRRGIPAPSPAGGKEAAKDAAVARAQASRSVAKASSRCWNRCPYVPSVICIEACPSIRWILDGLSPRVDGNSRGRVPQVVQAERREP